MAVSTKELDGKQVSTWTDIGYIATSQISTEQEERGAITLMPKVRSSPLEVASTGATTSVSERPDGHGDAQSPSKGLMSRSSGNGGSNVPSSILPNNVLNLNSGSLESVREGLNLVEALTEANFDLISVEIMRWVNAKDIQTLHRITQLIIEKAIKPSSSSSDPYFCLCKAMVKYPQTLHWMTRLIVKKAMEDPRGTRHCAQLCNMMKDHGNAADGAWFGEYLGEICQESLEAIAASVATASDHMARIRRLRLIEFIGWVENVWTPVIMDKWMAALLDADNEEKVATLCMLMTRVAHTSHDMSSWLQRVKNVAQETSKPRVRKLLQGVRMTEGYNARIVAELSEDCIVQ